MGTFNTIAFNKKIALPELPTYVEPSFQTKDWNDSHFFAHFTVEENGKILQHCMESEWVEDETALLKGHFKPVKEWTEHLNYTGHINIYTHYHHAKYVHPTSFIDEDWTFDCGWIEYSIQIVSGFVMLDTLVVVEHTKPVMRTPEEAETKKETVLALREENRKKYEALAIENRINYPTPEQILIDDIYEHTDNVYIRSHIEEYRTKHDKYYEKTKQ